MATVKKPIKKAQDGTKATKDSTDIFKNKAKDMARKSLYAEVKGDKKLSNVYMDVASKFSSDASRQSKKGKPGYDKNGYPIKKNGGSVKAKEGKWIQKAINPAHKGYCTPMTKPTCTPKRKALAITLKKMTKKKKK